MQRKMSLSAARTVLGGLVAFAMTPGAVVSARQAAQPSARPPISREEQKRALAKETAKWPGWKLHETAHYFLLTPVADAAFVERVKTTSEAIRSVIRDDFPHPELDPVPIATAPSTIRLLANREQYLASGAPRSSSGSWNRKQREIVIHDEPEADGRDETCGSLQGMIFLEYVSTLAEGDRGAPWFVYGHSDYYGGFVERDGKPVFATVGRRVRLAQDNIQAKKTVPLPMLVQLSPAEYAGGEFQSQAWSFVWFLRQGSSRTDLWKPAWNGILERWWAAWCAARDARVANERAFAGIDWAELEAAWKQFVLSSS